ncbi:serine hydrolase [Streptococcus dentasini]
MRIKTGNENIIFFALIVLLPIFLVSFWTVKGDREVSSSSWKQFDQVSERQFDYFYFAKVPANPNVYRTVKTYADSNLTKVSGKIDPDSKIKIKKVFTNSKGIPLFQFANGTYAKASYSQFYDDKVLAKRTLGKEKSYWTGNEVAIYEKPYVTGMVSKRSAVTAYSKIQVSERALTHHGSYLFIKGQGWINEALVSQKDKRIEAVQDFLKKKYNNPNKYSIYVEQLDNGKTAEINADKTMYSASVSKLPLLYYVQEQLNKGKIDSSKKLVYNAAVNDFKSAYKTEGSGIISKTPDNKTYSIKDLEQKVTQYSDNVATNILGYYVANQYNEDFQKTIKSAIGTDWNMENRKVSAKIAGKMMTAIYEQNGDITNYLSSTDFDKQRISKNIPVKVAHKIGDAYEYRHDVAIVYGDTPFVLSVFTENATYDDITAIADGVYRILK